MAKILIIGASSGIGFETLKAGLEAGHEIRAFARSADKIAIDDPRLEKVNGDATEPADVEAALHGADAVIESLGVPLSMETVLQGTDLFSKATRILVDAMEKNGPRRLLAVTGLGAGNARDSLNPLEKIGFELSLRRIYDDKDIEEMIIRNSSLEWTIARPGILRDGPATGVYQVLNDEKDWRLGEVRRADVAHFLISEIERPNYVHQTPMLSA